MRQITTREALDHAPCSYCEKAIGDHTEGEVKALYLHSRCHPNAPTWAIYEGDGLLRITCCECQAEIATLRIT